MAKNKPKTPAQPTETPNERQARLQRALDGVNKVLTEERAFLTMTSLQILPDGRVSPEIRIQINP